MTLRPIFLIIPIFWHWIIYSDYISNNPPVYGIYVHWSNPHYHRIFRTNSADQLFSETQGIHVSFPGFISSTKQSNYFVLFRNDACIELWKRCTLLAVCLSNSEDMWHEYPTFYVQTKGDDQVSTWIATRIMMLCDRVASTLVCRYLVQVSAIVGLWFDLSWWT